LLSSRDIGDVELIDVNDSDTNEKLILDKSINHYEFNCEENLLEWTFYAYRFDTEDNYFGTVD